MSTIFDFITDEHFHKAISPERAKKLLKKSVQMVEIETFSFCNRKCYFCPNSFIDRNSENIRMDESLYLKILKELSEITYDGAISYSRYNEPLADRVILQRLEQAYEILPKAGLHLNTNGDYLTKEYLSELYNSGLRSLNIQIYLLDDSEHSATFVSEKIVKIMIKLGLSFELTQNKPNEWIEAHSEYKEMGIRIYWRNFKKNGCNRGGLLSVINPEYHRTSPCLSPFYHVYIDYNGNAVPCCNIRSDAPQHQEYIVGNISGQTIFEIYASEKMARWRRDLIDFSLKKGICGGCNFVTYEPTPENITVNQKISRQIEPLSGWSLGNFTLAI